MANPPLSHVTTRRLTKPWEGAQRALFHYNFTTDSFDDETSRTLLTADESYGYEVERFLNERVEVHLATYLDSVAAGGLSTAIPWPQERALILSVFIQSLRVRAGRGDADALRELRELLAKGDEYLDQFVTAARRDFRYVGGRVPAGQLLYFPSDGITALPMVGTTERLPAMLFQPTTLTTFFAAVPVGIPEETSDRQLQEAMATGLLVAFSVGLVCDRVIIPPEIRGRADEAAMRTSIRTLRSAAEGFTRIIGQMNRMVGF